MSIDLLLTLGHGSSAIAIHDGVIKCGYEEERLTRRKAESQFPINAINKCGYNHYDSIYVSHWHPLGLVNQMSARHWKPHLLPYHDNLVCMSPNLSHHDCHAYSVAAFDNTEAFTLVCDGFGNYGEVLSLYDTNMNLVHRSRGYYSSLGLMYQYATTAMDLKPNQDEFKLLGYESKLSLIDQFGCVDHIKQLSKLMLSSLHDFKLGQEDDPLYDTASLVRVQEYWHSEFQCYHGSKTHIAYVAQQVLENVICDFVRKWPIYNLKLAGGVFMNVKLNMMLQSVVPGKVVTMPLSGDQGAAIGMYKWDNPDWMMPNHLYWGKRDLVEINAPRTITCNEKVFATIVKNLLSDNKIVNVVCGDMEFGPRALCNTSTLALASKLNAQYINMVNERTSIMPMGPVVSESSYHDYFYRANVGDSTKYMSTSVLYKHEEGGASHIWPDGTTHTGRPQIIDPNHILASVVDYFKILINTSFNTHGTPIVYDKQSIMEAIQLQQTHDAARRIHTVILESS